MDGRLMDGYTLAEVAMLRYSAHRAGFSEAEQRVLDRLVPLLDDVGVMNINDVSEATGVPVRLIASTGRRALSRLRHPSKALPWEMPRWMDEVFDISDIPVPEEFAPVAAEQGENDDDEDS